MNRAESASTSAAAIPAAERWLLAAAVVAGLAARVVLAPQFEGLDDFGYLEAAHKISRGESLDGMFALFQTRVGMSYPLGWALKYSLLAPAQFWWITCLADVIATVALYLAARQLSGPAAGAIAASLYAAYPLAIQQATVYMPTAFQVAFISVALALLAHALLLPFQRGWRWGVAAGTSLGAAYLVKEDAAVVVPALLLAAVVARVPDKRIFAAVAAGAALIFGIECLTYGISTGQPLYRLTATSGLGGLSAEQGLHIAAIWHWSAYLRTLFLVPVQVGLYWWVGLLAMIAILQRGQPTTRVVAYLLLVICLYLQFGSGSIFEYSPLPKTPRYTAIATPFVIAVAAFWLASDRIWRRSRRLILGAIAISSLACVLIAATAGSERTRNTIASIDYFTEAPAAPVYTDYFTSRALRLLGPTGLEIRPWYHADFRERRVLVLASPESTPGAYVFVDDQMAKVYTSSYELTLPPSLVNTPKGWPVVWRHQAYPDGGPSRFVLERLRSVAHRWPDSWFSRRVLRNVADMLDGDGAVIYQVPGVPAR